MITLSSMYGHQLLDLGGRDERHPAHAPGRRGDHPPLAAPPCAPRCARPRCRRTRCARRAPRTGASCRRERGHLARVVDREDEVGGVPGGAARVGQRALVEQHQVGPAELGQVVRRGCCRRSPRRSRPRARWPAGSSLPRWGRPRRSPRVWGWPSSLIYHTPCTRHESFGARCSRSRWPAGPRASRTCSRASPSTTVLGLVMRRPCGALGASALLTAAITAFYDVQRARSERFFVYPDYFLFHVGGPLGEHGRLDVWPRRKEVVVEDDPERSSRRRRPRDHAPAGRGRRRRGERRARR